MQYAAVCRLLYRLFQYYFGTISVLFRCIHLVLLLDPFGTMKMCGNLLKYRLTVYKRLEHGWYTVGTLLVHCCHTIHGKTHSVAAPQKNRNPEKKVKTKPIPESFKFWDLITDYCSDCQVYVITWFISPPCFAFLLISLLPKTI